MRQPKVDNKAQRKFVIALLENYLKGNRHGLLRKALFEFSRQAKKT